MKPRVRNGAIALMAAAIILIVVGVTSNEVEGFWIAMTGAFLAVVATMIVTVDASKRSK